LAGTIGDQGRTVSAFCEHDKMDRNSHLSPLKQASNRVFMPYASIMVLDPPSYAQRLDLASFVILRLKQTTCSKTVLKTN